MVWFIVPIVVGVWVAALAVVRAAPVPAPQPEADD